MIFSELSTIFYFLSLFSVIVPGVCTVVVAYVSGEKFVLDDLANGEPTGMYCGEKSEKLRERERAIVRQFKDNIATAQIHHGGLKSFCMLFVELLLKHGVSVYVPGFNKYQCFFTNYEDLHGDFRKKHNQPGYVYSDKAPSEKYLERMRLKKDELAAKTGEIDRDKEKAQFKKIKRRLLRNIDYDDAYNMKINRTFNRMLKVYADGCKMTTLYGFKFTKDLTTRYSKRDFCIIPTCYLSKVPIGYVEQLYFNGVPVGQVVCYDRKNDCSMYRVHLFDCNDDRYDYTDVVSDHLVDVIMRDQQVFNLDEVKFEDQVMCCEVTPQRNSWSVALSEYWTDLDDEMEVNLNSLVGSLEFNQFLDPGNGFPERFKLRDDITGNYCDMYGPSTTHCWLYCLNECLYHQFLQRRMTMREVQNARNWIIDFVQVYGNVGENHQLGQTVPQNQRHPVPAMNTVNFAIGQNGRLGRIHQDGGLNEISPSHWPANFDAYESPLPGSLTLNKLKILYNSFATTFNIPIELYVMKINFKVVDNHNVPVPPAATCIRYGPRDRIPYRVCIVSTCQTNGQQADQISHDMHAYFGININLGNGNYYFMNEGMYRNYISCTVGMKFHAVCPRLHNSEVIDIVKTLPNLGDRCYNVVCISQELSMKYTGRNDCTYLICPNANFRCVLEGETNVDRPYVEALMRTSEEDIRVAPIKFVPNKQFGGTELKTTPGVIKIMKRYTRYKYWLLSFLFAVVLFFACSGVDVYYKNKEIRENEYELYDIHHYCHFGDPKPGEVYNGHSWHDGCGKYDPDSVVCRFAKPSWYEMLKLRTEATRSLNDTIHGMPYTRTQRMPDRYDYGPAQHNIYDLYCYLQTYSGVFSQVVSHIQDKVGVKKECFTRGVYSQKERDFQFERDLYPFCKSNYDCPVDVKCYAFSWGEYVRLMPGKYLIPCVVIMFTIILWKWLTESLIVNLDFGMGPSVSGMPLVPLILMERVLETVGNIYITQGPPQAALRALKETKSPTIVGDMMMYYGMTGKKDWMQLKGDVSGLYAAVPGIYQCPSIPFAYPDIPVISGSCVKLDDPPMATAQYYQMLACPPSMMLDEKLYIHYNRSTAESIDHALFCRLMLGRHGQHINYGAIYDAYTKWYDRNMDFFQEARELGLEELVKIHPRGTRYKDSPVGYEEALNTVFTGFIKCEPYDIDTKVKPNRAIISPGKKATVWGLKFTHLIEKGLHKSPNFSKAKNSQATALDLKRIWDKFNNCIAVGCDFTQFENGVNVPVLIGSMSMFHTLCGMPEDYIKNWMHRTIYFAKRWKVELFGKRISGEYQTSLGNMIIVGTILQRVCDLAAEQGVTMDYYSAGDDCMIFCEKEDKDLAVSLIQRVVREFGMLIKIEDFYEEFDRIHFCQQYPVETDQGWWMINDIKRVFDKLLVQPKVMKDSKHQRNRVACLGDYLNYMYPNVDFVQTVVKNFYSYWNKEHRYSKAFNSSHDWHIIEVQKSTDDFTPKYKILHVDRMLEVMGFPDWVGEYYNDYFQDVNIFNLNKQRDIEFEYDVEKKDMFIQLMFFERHFLKPKFENTTTVDALQVATEDRSLNHVTDHQFKQLIHVSMPNAM